MTDKRQSDALHLAGIADDGAWTFAIGVRKEIAAELRRQYAEIETLRTGYAAARLEVGSLQLQLTDQGRVLEKVMHELVQTRCSTKGGPTTAYAELPKGDSAAPQLRAMATNYPAGHLWDKLDAKACIRGALEIEALRASHGQAPAQAAPTYKDSTPELHIGDSAFESWYNTYSPAHKSDKQRARDTYAAGMGEPLVTAAPAAVEGPWSLGDIEGNWREIDHKNHQGVIRIVWEMEDDKRSLDCEALAVDVVDALNAAQPAPQHPGVSNNRFDHKTAADFLNGRTVSDEAMRKFVAASRWAHDDRAGLQAKLLSVRNELAAREAEIALLKTELMDAEAAPQQEAQSALFDKQGFHEWVLRNLPYDTIIGNSAYWADHLSKGIQRFVKAAPQPSPAAQGDAPESEYRRGYRHGYEQRDAEVRGALV